ncbi:MAG: caspase family protein, partial [Chloroflexi bacterium]
MSVKYALIIGNTEYTDPGLAQLTAPGRDAEDFARVLRESNICGFDQVDVLMNQASPAVIEAVDNFFNQRKPDDLLVLYFSGHGVRDELGALYLAVKNTNRFRLRSTAVKSDFIREVMDQSRSKRQVLILDCCNSGAFPQGTKAATGVSIGTAAAFEAGYGRIILTASDSTQYAWEGDQVIGETDNSLFTHFLVKGLEGEADRDSDGRITVDELYDYAYEKVKLSTPKQTPSKFSSKQQGE